MMGRCFPRLTHIREDSVGSYEHKTSFEGLEALPENLVWFRTASVNVTLAGLMKVLTRFNSNIRNVKRIFRFPENIRDDDLSEILPLLPDSLEHVDLSKTELSTLGVAKLASRLVNLVHLECPHDVTLVADIPTLLPLLPPHIEILSTEVGQGEWVKNGEWKRVLELRPETLDTTVQQQHPQQPQHPQQQQHPLPPIIVHFNRVAKLTGCMGGLDDVIDCYHAVPAYLDNLKMLQFLVKLHRLPIHGTTPATQVPTTVRQQATTTTTTTSVSTASVSFRVPFFDPTPTYVS